MRYTYVVAYDVSDPKRLRQVFKTMRGYGDPMQLSVFRCDLNAREMVELRAKLRGIIHHTEDQVLFVLVGRSEGRGAIGFETMGRPYADPERAAIVL